MTGIHSEEVISFVHSQTLRFGLFLMARFFLGMFVVLGVIEKPETETTVFGRICLSIRSGWATIHAGEMAPAWRR